MVSEEIVSAGYFDFCRGIHFEATAAVSSSQNEKSGVFVTCKSDYVGVLLVSFVTIYTPRRLHLQRCSGSRHKQPVDWLCK